MKFYKIISEVGTEEIIKCLTCESDPRIKEVCLRSDCSLCKEKEIRIFYFDIDGPAKYEKWVTKKERIVVKGKEKLYLKNKDNNYKYKTKTCQRI